MCWTSLQRRGSMRVSRGCKEVLCLLYVLLHLFTFCPKFQYPYRGSCQCPRPLAPRRCARRHVPLKQVPQHPAPLTPTVRLPNPPQRLPFRLLRPHPPGPQPRHRPGPKYRACIHRSARRCPDGLYRRRSRLAPLSGESADTGLFACPARRGAASLQELVGCVEDDRQERRGAGAVEGGECGVFADGYGESARLSLKV